MLAKSQVTVVTTREHARAVAEKMRAYYPSAVWACDTEVADIDLKTQGPVGNGKVTCVSVYGGTEVDFGDGPGGTLWVENIGAAAGVLQELRGFFEDPAAKKVWHNYGFDRHVMSNEGIACAGFAGDTMHMARLWDSARDKASGSGGEGYSLESLSTHFFGQDANYVKTSMKELFGVARLKKDGAAGKVKELPSVAALQLGAERERFVEYSAKDAVATWWVHHELQKHLEGMPWVVGGTQLGTLRDFYDRYLRDFGELLTEMEQTGIKVDTAGHLREAEVRAREEKAAMEQRFLSWAAGYCPDIRHVNVGSTGQMQQLLFGEFEGGRLKNRTRVFKIDRTPEELAQETAEALARNPYAGRTAVDLKEALKARGLRVAGKKGDLVARLREDDQRRAMEALPLLEVRQRCEARGLDSSGAQDELIERFLDSEPPAAEAEDDAAAAMPKRQREISITTIGMPPTDFTPGGQPQTSAAVLKKLAGANLFGDGERCLSSVVCRVSC